MGKKYFVHPSTNPMDGTGVYDSSHKVKVNASGYVLVHLYPTPEEAITRCTKLNKEAGDVEEGVRYFVDEYDGSFDVHDCTREPTDFRVYNSPEEAIDSCYHWNFPEVKVETKKSWIVSVENGFSSEVEASNAAEKVAKNHAGEKVNLYVKVAEVTCEQPIKWTEIKES